MDYNEKKRIYEGKREWAEKRKLKNAAIETLTEEQHNVLYWLCSIRHELHVKRDDVFHNNSNALAPFDNSCGECEVNSRLKTAGLKPIDLQFEYVDCPIVSDFDCLSSDEQEEWEEKAEQCNAENPTGMWHNAISMWIQESWEYKEFMQKTEELNDKIEEYLKEIDEKHGTDYCPSGYTRLL